MGNKRQDYISWDEYFMGVAFLAAMRSKDPGTQVGACIVSTDNKILSIGYNGMPIGCNDDDFPWNRESEDPYNNKYFYTTHSELNAILNYRGGSLEGAKIYVTLFPCNECAKAIIQLSLIHISEPTRLGMISYAVFCLKKKSIYLSLIHITEHTRLGMKSHAVFCLK